MTGTAAPKSGIAWPQTHEVRCAVRRDRPALTGDASMGGAGIIIIIGIIIEGEVAEAAFPEAAAKARN